MFLWILIQASLSLNSPENNPNTVIFAHLTQPMLDPFRRLVPPMGGIDLTPIVAILAIKLFQIVVVGSITQAAQQMIG